MRPRFTRMVFRVAGRDLAAPGPGAHLSGAPPAEAFLSTDPESEGNNWPAFHAAGAGVRSDEPGC